MGIVCYYYLLQGENRLFRGILQKKEEMIAFVSFINVSLT